MIRSLSTLAIAACLGSCIPEANAIPPIAEVPAHLAGLSPSDLSGLVKNLPAHVPLEAVQMVPGVGPAFVDSFTVSCSNSAATVITSDYGLLSYTCQNASTTMIQVGDSTISDPGTTRDAPIYCATNCPAQEWGGNAHREYCRGDTTTTIYCRGLVKASVIP